MQSARLLALVVCAFSALISAKAEPRMLDTYKSIIDRNPFGLKDPPPPPPPAATNAPKPEVKKEEFYLTGISTIGNAKHPKAYLLAKDANKKEYDQKFYNLTVGDRQGDLTLLDVDTKGRRVKVAYLGEEKWLSMKENSVPAPAGGPAAGIPGVPGGVPGAMPVPLPNNAPGSAPAPAPQPLSYPNANNRRTPRTAGSYSPGGYSGGMNPASASTSYGAANNASMIPPSPTGNGQIPTGPQTDVDVLKQVATMQHDYNESLKGNGPQLPPFPGLPSTPQQPNFNATPTPPVPR